MFDIPPPPPGWDGEKICITSITKPFCYHEALSNLNLNFHRYFDVIDAYLIWGCKTFMQI